MIHHSVATRPRCPRHPSKRPQALSGSLTATVRRFGFLLPGALAFYLAIKGAHPALPGFPCPLRALTGIPCPTCFLTRATAAALNLRIEESLQLHAFGLPLALGLLGWSVLSIRQRRLQVFPLRGSNLSWATMALLLYWLLRLISRYGLGLPAFPSS